MLAATNVGLEMLSVLEVLFAWAIEVAIDVEGIFFFSLKQKGIHTLDCHPIVAGP